MATNGAKIKSPSHGRTRRTHTLAEIEKRNSRKRTTQNGKTNASGHTWSDVDVDADGCLCLVGPGLVWSSLWLYWPHGRHALFGSAICG